MLRYGLLLVQSRGCRIPHTSVVYLSSHPFILSHPSSAGVSVFPWADSHEVTTYGGAPSPPICRQTVGRRGDSPGGIRIFRRCLFLENTGRMNTDLASPNNIQKLCFPKVFSKADILEDGKNP